VVWEAVDIARMRAGGGAQHQGRNAEGDLWPSLVMVAWMREN